MAEQENKLLLDATEIDPMPDTYRLNLEAVGSDEEFEGEILEAWGERWNQHIGGWSPVPLSDWFGQIPEKRQSAAHISGFTLPVTDTNLWFVNSYWTKKQIVFADEYTENVCKAVHLRTQISERNRLTYAAWKNNQTVPEHSLVMSPDPDLALSPYQQVAASMASSVPGFGLLMEQGTGKTPVGVCLMDNLPKKEGRPLFVMIACPKAVRSNWAREIRKFSAYDDWEIVILKGLKEKRFRLISQAAGNAVKRNKRGVVIISTIETMQNTWEPLQLLQYDLALLDEAQAIRTPSTKRCKAMWKLRGKAKKRVVLTGTPIGNTPMDLYAQFEFMGKGYSGFSSFAAFKRFFGQYRTNEDGYKSLVELQNIPILKDRLSRYTFMISKAEAMPYLPDKQYDTAEVELSPEQHDAYVQLRDELIVELEEMAERAEREGGAAKALVVQNMLVQMLRLAQITSGFLVIPEEQDPETGEPLSQREEIHFVPNPKIEWLLNEVSDKPMTSKTIIWACFQNDIEKIHRHLTQAGHKAVAYYGKTSDNAKEEAIRLFNEDDSVRFFVGNPGAGGAGLNLLGYPPGFPERSECNADHAIYFSQNWKSLDRAQSEDRNHRRGTRVPIRITDLNVPGTIDEEIRVRVAEKRINAMEVTNIREILHNLKEML